MSTARHTHTITGGSTSRTRRGIRPRVLLALPTAVAVAALIGSPSLAAAPTAAAASTYTAPDATAQGFIMSDGRICDPIRHIGC